jgi:cell division protein FtsW (lipid II flippase)
MTRGGRLFFFFAAAPAVAGSVLLMQSASVDRSLIVQQIVAFGAGGTALALVAPSRQRQRANDFHRWIGVALLACLFLPVVVSSGSGPHRWVNIFGLRLYLAPVILPVMLLLLSRSVEYSTAHAGFSAVAAIVASLALLLQPDAAQLGAWACAVVPIVWICHLPRTVRALI